MQGRRPILEGVRGYLLLDCDVAVDVSSYNIYYPESQLRYTLYVSHSTLWHKLTGCLRAAYCC